MTTITEVIRQIGTMDNTENIMDIMMLVCIDLSQITMMTPVLDTADSMTLIIKIDMDRGITTLIIVKGIIQTIDTIIIIGIAIDIQDTKIIMVLIMVLNMEVIMEKELCDAVCLIMTI